MRLSQQKKSIVFPLLLAAVSWFLVWCLVFFVNPEVLKSIWYAPFWILLWLAMTWTVSLVLGKLVRGMFYSTALSIFLILRLFDIGTVLNGFLIGGLVFLLDWSLFRIERRVIS